MEKQTVNQNGAAVAVSPARNMQTLLAATPARGIPSLPEVEQRFVTLVKNIQRQPEEVAKAIFHAETFHYLKLINENQGVRECDQLSLYGCFVDMAVNGLSFDPTKKLCYILPGNVNVGTKETPVWTKRASLQISPYGELAIRQRMGQIKYADNPVIVYEGDEFSPFIGENGEKKIKYSMNVNHGTKIIGAFIRIVRNDGSTDLQWLLQEDVIRLSGYSAKKNKGYANALYSSSNGGIDPGFLGAKMIKHAFKSYPKVNVAGTFSEVEKDTETEPENIYGFDPAKATALPPAQPLHREPIDPNLSDSAKAAILHAHAEEMPEGPSVNFSETVNDDGSGF